ncbi:MAG: L-seryl-tRNA(Sec) selenium transferase [Clostridia bacterium]|nr:L-seryl-tRNA(Sec) selenium transferase [Clostridia bacterium]
MGNNELLRRIPKVDNILRHEAVASLPIPARIIADVVRGKLENLRQSIINGQIAELPDEDEIIRDILSSAKKAAKASLRRVINATGVTLHTNLGRACLSEKAIAAIAEAAGNYSTLEYNLEAGERGSRHAHVEGLLCRLTGAEAAMAVNNNAAAVLLILSALGQGGEVVVSRGELVEIGGSFRIPEIMEQCGCRLREVGATNKTHLRDYERAINSETRALLKVHTSNFRIIGFSESVSLEELVALGERAGLPVIEDLGSGCLFDLELFGIYDEPAVIDSVKAGADIISFSGDKLLGGPQAGIILCKKKWIDRLKRHPLARAVRLDKMTLAALESTLDSYLDPQRALNEIPTLRMLASSPDELREKARRLKAALNERGVDCRVIDEIDQVGGGSAPMQQIPTSAVAIVSKNISADELERRLRLSDPPVVGRIVKDQYLLSVRTLFEKDFADIAQIVSEAII